jgi:hypothetical protein
MNRKAFFKLIIFLFTLISGALVFIGRFAPDKIDSEDIPYKSHVIKVLFPEMVALFIIGALYLVSSLQDSTKQQKARFLICTLAILSIFIIANYGKLHSIIRQRHIAYWHLNDSYKYEMYNNLYENINKGNIPDAIETGEKIIKEFPNQGVRFTEINKRLNSRMAYANKLYPLGPIYTREKHPLFRENFMNLLFAFSLDPSDDYANEVKECKDSLYKLNAVIDSIYSCNDTVKGVEIINRNRWFLFSRNEKYPSIKSYALILSTNKNEFKGLIDSSWALNWADSLLRWKYSLTHNAVKE